MRVIEFGGGLGDIFIDLWKYNIYTQLDALPPGEKVQIVLRSANPGVRDLFQWHPKSSQFEIFDIRSANPWGPEERKRFGIYPEATPPGPRNDAPVNFYPSPEDKNLLATIKHPYIVFAISAGAPVVNIPIEIAEEAADMALGKGFQVVAIGKNFCSILKDLSRNIEESLKREELRLKSRPGLVDTIDRLSVPGMAHLVRDSAAVFCCHSSLKHVSWQFRKPVFILWHECKRREWEELCGTTWGRSFHGTRNFSFSDWRASSWSSFLDEFAKR